MKMGKIARQKTGKHEDGKHDSEYPHGNKHNGKHDKDGTNAIRVVTTERFYEYDENWQLTKCTEKEENKGTNTYSYEYDSVAGVTVPVAWESVAMVGTGAVTVRSAFGNMFKVSIVYERGQFLIIGAALP